VKIRLAGWDSTGLRSPDVKLSLAEHGKVPRLVLLQMPNGTGKTTTLNLIQAAMTGSAANWTAEQIGDLQRAGATNPTGTFVLRLLVDTSPLVFEIHFDFVEGAAAYRTSSPSLGGVVEGWKCPPTVRRFLTESFASLFVFDAEFADRLLKPQFAEAERAIDALCQLDLLDRTAAVAESDWDRASRGQGARTPQGLNLYRNRRDSLEKREKDLSRALKGLKRNNELLKEEAAQHEKSIADRIAESQKFREQSQELRERVSNARLRLAAASLQVMAYVRQPQLLDDRFGRALIAFRDSLDRARLPEASSRQFFLELAEEAECICGRPISDHERGQILEHASKYLGDELAGVINAIKADIGQHVGGDVRVAERQLYKVSTHELGAAEAEYHEADTALQALTAEAFREDEEKQLMSIQAQITEKRGQIEENEDQIREIERSARSTDDENTLCLAAIRKQLREARDKIAEISNTVRMRQETVAIQQLAARSKIIARDKLREVLRVECNERLRRILANDPIQIKRIGQSLELEKQRGASVGQTLAVGYTFLTSVLHRGSHDFPLIVDSPAGSLDDKVRREVGAMIPVLCEQFTAFMIPTERPYFLQALESRGTDDIRYLTLFRKSSGTQTLIQGLPNHGVTQTTNAVLVDGRDYFNQFELADEPEES
jgi:DNA sulfur modification protein DndD